MAKMPSDVQLIYNPMTAAPGFILNNVYVFLAFENNGSDVFTYLKT